MSGDQIPSLPGKKRRQIPGVCPGGGGDVEASIWLVHYRPNSPRTNKALHFDVFLALALYSGTSI